MKVGERFLHHHTLPMLMFDYTGCLIVEVHDHRSTPPPVPQRQGLTLSFQLNNIREAPPPDKAEIYRIVLGPNPATLWTDLGIVEKRWAAEKEEDGDEEPGWTEDTAVELEAIILVSYISSLILICLSSILFHTKGAYNAATLSRPIYTDIEGREFNAESDNASTTEAETILWLQRRR